VMISGFANSGRILGIGSSSVTTPRCTHCKTEMEVRSLVQEAIQKTASDWILGELGSSRERSKRFTVFVGWICERMSVIEPQDEKRPAYLCDAPQEPRLLRLPGRSPSGCAVRMTPFEWLVLGMKVKRREVGGKKYRYYSTHFWPIGPLKYKYCGTGLDRILEAQGSSLRLPSAELW
jgi:hypothetical protein